MNKLDQIRDRIGKWITRAIVAACTLVIFMIASQLIWHVTSDYGTPHADAQAPVATIAPTASPTPNPDSIGELMKDPSKAYVLQTNDNLRLIGEQLNDLSNKLAKPQWNNETWLMQVIYNLQELDRYARYEGAFNMYRNVVPSDIFKDVDQEMVNARLQMIQGANHALNAMNALNRPGLTQGMDMINQGAKAMIAARQHMQHVSDTNGLNIPFY